MSESTASRPKTTPLRVAPDADPLTARRVRNALRVAEHLLRRGDARRACEVYLSLAEHYAEAGALQPAVAVGFRALRVDASRLAELSVANLLRRIGPPALPLCLAVVQSHLRADRIDAAIRVAEVMLEIDPDDPSIRDDLAQLYVVAARPEAAIDLLYACACQQASAGDDRGYVRVARHILSIDGHHLPTLRGVVMSCLRLGELDAAMAAVDVLLRADPENPAALQVLARVNAELGRLDVCFDGLRRLVNTLQERGDDEAAQALLARARDWSTNPVHRRRLVALRAGLESSSLTSQTSSSSTPVVQLPELSAVPDAPRPPVRQWAVAAE